jgi:uncharacterized protein YcbX
VGHVVSLFRYPLKSARGEQLRALCVDVEGVRCDRSWACLDDADGTVGSAKHPDRWGRLLEVIAQVDEHSSEVIVQVQGRRAVAGSELADAFLSEHLGRPVRLTRSVPDLARLHRQLPEERGLVPDWMTGAVPGQEMVTDVSGARPGGRFVDFGPVHLLTTGALAELARQLGRASVDARRFRPNVVLDALHDPAPGQELEIGDVVLRVVLPTPRCIVPGLEDEGAAVDRQLLSALARHHRTVVADLGQAACFGVYAEVLRPGRLKCGQVVR